MRVLMVAHAFPPTIGGVESHLADVMHGLAERGHDVSCLVGGSEDSDEDDVFPVRRRRVLQPRALMDADGGLWHQLEAEIRGAVTDLAPDLVHAHNGHHYGDALCQALLGAAGVPVVNTVHDPVSEGASVSAVAAPWAMTLYVSAFMSRCLPTSGSFRIVPLGIDLDRFTPTGDRHPLLTDLERPVIFHPARLLAWKGVEVGVEAFARVRRTIGSGTLVLCGSEDIITSPWADDGFRSSILERVDRLGLRPHVRLLAFDRRDMPQAYRASDLVWYPTTGDEPLGLVPLEAMACAVPVVVSDSGGLTETVEPGVAGLVVPRGDVEALHRAAVGILTDPDARARLVEAGRRRVTRFGLPRYIDQLESVYQDVV